VRPRSFTIEQANACIPRVRLLVERLQRGALRMHEARGTLAHTKGCDAEAVRLDELLAARPELRLVVEEVDAAMAEIDRLGAELKDVSLGLVDFPAALNGEEAYLCWQYGEDCVRFWHRRGEGFAGRRPLPGVPPPPELQ
jgi:hypothetical protein